MAEENNVETTRETIKIALSSQGDHACRNDPEGMCPVTSAIYDDMLSVKNKKYLSCPSYIPFGYGGFCNSPIRKEIYKKYNR